MPGRKLLRLYIHWLTGVRLIPLAGHDFTLYMPILMMILTGGRMVLVLDAEGNRGRPASQMMLIGLNTFTFRDGDTVKFTSG